MNILVIGSKGFVGSHVVEFFSDKKYTVSGSDMSAPDGTENYNYFNSGTGGAGLHEIFASIKPDICINAAGNGSVPVSLVNPQLDFEANVHFNFFLLELIRQYQPHCKYVYLSSAAVYGNPISLPIKETDLIKPFSPYGWHKYLAELLCKEYAVLYKMNTVSLRVFSVYGPRLRKQIFWDTYQKMKKEGDIMLFGSGHESRDFIYIDDLMDAINCILLKANLTGQSVNVASGTETSIDEAIQLFLQIAGNRKGIIYSHKNKPGDPINWRANIDELTSYGFKNKVSLHNGLINTIEWLKENA